MKLQIEQHKSAIHISESVVKPEKKQNISRKVITCFTAWFLLNSSRALSENREFSLSYLPLPG
jgi:hypothetical protein